MDKTFLGGVAVAGAMIGVGQLMLSSQKITLRLAAGRAVVTSALAMTAFAALAWFPALPKDAILGLACIMASLGTTFLEHTVSKLVDKLSEKI